MIDTAFISQSPFLLRLVIFFLLVWFSFWACFILPIKIRERDKQLHGQVNNAMQATTYGDQSPAININQPTIILPPASASKPSISDGESKNGPIENFASKYTLAADLNIASNYMKVDGINVRGNVNANNTEGVEFNKMKVFNSDEYSKGKINIDRSQEFSVKENAVENSINIDRSKLFEVARNTVGKIVDRDKQAQESINVILTDSSTPSEVVLNLLIIQELIAKDDILANALGQRVESLDKENNGQYKKIVLTHLTRLNVETIQRAEAKGLGFVFYWLNFFLHFNT
jgi:hypothetical protein